MNTLNISAVEAAEELLKRRRAREGFEQFCCYVDDLEQPQKHHLLICNAADRIVSGDLKRVLILMPPGSAKSTYATVKFPAFYLGKLPRKGVICASYNDTLATRFGKKTRNLVKNPACQRIFQGLALQQDSQAKGEWETSNEGFYFAVGVGGGVTGRRADLGIIDDPIRGRKDAESQLVRDNLWNWYWDDFRTRLKPDAAIMLIQTRWHEDDLAGRILGEDWNGESGTFTATDGEEWEVICIPAEAGENDILGRAPGEFLWTDYFTGDFWENTKKSLLIHSPSSWWSLYQQVPTPDQGIFFTRDKFKYYDELPEGEDFGSSDFATTENAGDFTEHGVFRVCPEGNVYIRDWWFSQATSDVWIEAMFELAQAYGIKMWSGETGPIRNAVEPYIKRTMVERKHFMSFQWFSHAEASKEQNARGFQALVNSGRVYLPKTEWAERLVKQLTSFPAGKYDDAVDTCSLFAKMINKLWAHKAVKSTQDHYDADSIDSIIKAHKSKKENSFKRL